MPDFKPPPSLFPIRILQEEQRTRMRKRLIAFHATLTPEQISERNQRIQIYNELLTPEQANQRKERAKEGLRVYYASLSYEQREEIIQRLQQSQSYEQRRELGRRNIQAYNASLTREQRLEMVRRMREKAEMTPNGIESHMISLLRELGIYTEDAQTAQSGQVYYVDSNENNRRFIKLTDGRAAIPDFKVKGRRKVIEIYGDYWHSQKFCESKGDPEYKWNPEKMIEEYKTVGYDCLIFWEKQLREPLQQEYIKQEIMAFVVDESLP
jgi:hypothetical protein